MEDSIELRDVKDYQRQGIGKRMVGQLMQNYQGFHQHAVLATKMRFPFTNNVVSSDPFVLRCGSTMATSIEERTCHLRQSI